MRWIFSLVLVCACSPGHQSPPSGPPPEYEHPELPPWDSGAREQPEVDPFANAAEGEWLEETDTPDAGHDAMGDAAAGYEAGADADTDAAKAP